MYITMSLETFAWQIFYFNVIKTNDVENYFCVFLHLFSVLCVKEYFQDRHRSKITNDGIASARRIIHAFRDATRGIDTISLAINFLRSFSYIRRANANRPLTRESRADAIAEE